MLIFLTTLLATLWSIFRSRASLGLENLALRHQIGVLHRSAGKRPKLTAGDRLLWICLSRLCRDWRSALAIVKPETVVAWHRAAFRFRRSATPRRRTAPPLRTTGCLNEPESTLPVLAFRLSSPKSARAQVHITTNLVHQIQAGSASPSTFAVHLEEYLRPLGCSEFSGGTDY